MTTSAFSSISNVECMHSFTVSTIGEDAVKDLFKKADMTLSLFEMTRKGFLNCEEFAASAILVRPRATAFPHCQRSRSSFR